MEIGSRFCNQDEIEYLEVLFPGARGIFSTRKGGVSRGPYSSLNLGLHVGDDPDRVLENRSLFADALDLPLDNFVAAEQVHGNITHVVSQEDKGRGARERESAIPGCDALVTDNAGAVLSTYYADCVPVYIVDPVRKVIGMAHAGWNGTVQDSAGSAVREMQRVWGSRPEECCAYLGPSIGPCCFEIGPEVAAIFSRELPGTITAETAGQDQKWTCDLWLANKKRLLGAGIAEDNIRISGLCTSCNSELFFSHRRDRGKTGRMAALIFLSKQE